MNFGQAIEEMLKGKRAFRRGWNGKNMFIYIEEGRLLFPLPVTLSEWIGKDACKALPHFNMWTAQETLVVGWLASQTDMLADDWEIIDD